MNQEARNKRWIQKKIFIMKMFWN